MMITGDIVRAIAPRRWAAVPEAAALTALAWLSHRAFWWDDPGYAFALFNPYLVAVILIAGRYGAPAGVATAAMGIAVAFTSSAFTSGGSFLAASTGGLTSLSMVAAAIVVGGVATWHRTRLAALVERHAGARTRITALEAEYRLALEEKDLEEKRVLSDEGSFIALVTMFDDLDRLDPEEIPERLVKVARRVLGGGQAALYRHRELIELVHGEGRWEPLLDAEAEPVLAAALATGHRASVADLRLAEGDKAPEKCLIAVPFKTEGEAYILAMGELNFVAFANDRLAALDGCVAIAGRALERARLFASTRDRNVVDPVTGACAYAFFQKRLAEEIALARRHRKPLTVLALRDFHYESLVDGQARTARHLELAAALKGALREGDLLAHHATGESFVLLLPFTPAAGARVVQKRISGGLGQAAAVHLIDVEPADARVSDVLFAIDLRLDPPCPGELQEAS